MTTTTTTLRVHTKSIGKSPEAGHNNNNINNSSNNERWETMVPALIIANHHRASIECGCHAKRPAWLRWLVRLLVAVAMAFLIVVPSCRNINNLPLAIVSTKTPQPRKEHSSELLLLLLLLGDSAANEADRSTTGLLRAQEAKKKKKIQPPRIPNVLLAGTQKASTTSLAVYLMNQNNTCFSDERVGEEGVRSGKEAHFFDDAAKFSGGLAAYQHLFRRCVQDDDNDDQQHNNNNNNNNALLLIDATPETMLMPQRVKRIYDEQGTTDQVKIIFILREPVSREISWYNHQLRYAELPDRPVWTNNIVDDDNGKQIQSFIRVQRANVMANFDNAQHEQIYGYYSYWLKLWSSYFDRSKQILILSYDELVHDPAMTLHRVNEFLNLNVTAGSDSTLPRENTNTKHTPAPPCRDQLELAEYFKHPNEELFAFLDENPGPEIEQRPFPRFQLSCQRHPQIPSVLLAGASMTDLSVIADHLRHQKNTCFSDDLGYDGSTELPHFFNSPDRYSRGLPEYQQMYEKCDYKSVLIDATPGNMLHPEKVKEIYDQQGTTDSLKIILILREPVSCQIRLYNQKLERGDTSVLPFLEMHRETDTIANSSYSRWLKRWFMHFNRTQVLVLSHAELIQGPSLLLQRVHKFLDRTFYGDLPIYEEKAMLQQSTPSCADQIEVASFYERYNDELYSLLEDNPGSEFEQRPFPRFQFACQNALTQNAT